MFYNYFQNGVRFLPGHAAPSILVNSQPESTEAANIENDHIYHEKINHNNKNIQDQPTNDNLKVKHNKENDQVYRSQAMNGKYQGTKCLPQADCKIGLTPLKKKKKKRRRFNFCTSEYNDIQQLPNQWPLEVGDNLIWKP